MNVHDDTDFPAGESLFLWVIVLLMAIVAFIYTGYAYQRQLAQERLHTNITHTNVLYKEKL